jgi:hypothetical protein
MAGVDGQSIAEFEAGLASDLDKLWNRLSSASYLSPPVRRVDIPFASMRMLAGKVGQGAAACGSTLSSSPPRSFWRQPAPGPSIS